MLKHACLVFFLVCLYCQFTAGADITKTANVECNGDSPIPARDSYATLNTDHFSLFYDANASEGEKIALVLERTYHSFYSLFTMHHFELRTPAEKLRWVIFSDQKIFNRYAQEIEGMDLSWLSGYYSAKTNLVAIVSPAQLSRWQVNNVISPSHNIVTCPPDAQTDLAKIVHEAAHQFSFNCGMQKRRVMYPLWAGEGLAMFFEHSMLTECTSTNEYLDLRRQRLSELHRQGKTIPFSELIYKTRILEPDSAIDVYAQSWGLFQFLWEHHADALKKYYARLYEFESGRRDDAAMRQDFIDTFGPLEQIQGQWMQFLEDLSSIPARSRH